MKFLYEFEAKILDQKFEDFWPKFSIIWPNIGEKFEGFLNLSKNLKFFHKISRKLSQNVKIFRKFYQKRQKLDQKLAKIWNFFIKFDQKMAKSVDIR